MKPGGAPNRQLLLLRALWLLIAGVGLIALVLSAPSQFAAIRDGQGSSRLTESAFEFYQLTSPELRLLEEAGGSAALYASYLFAIEFLWLMAFFAPAALIFWRRFDEPIGQLAAFALMLLGIYGLPSQSLAFISSPGSNTSIGLLPELNLGGAVGAMLLVPFAYRFPNGRFVPRWTRGPAYVAPVAGILLILLVLAQLLSQRIGTALLLLLLLTSGLLGFWAQVHRYRKVSTSVERQQTKWVFFGLAGSAAGNLIVTLPYLLEPAILQPGPLRVIYLLVHPPVTVASNSLIPLTIALCIIRYRLWDIDLVVRRTLVYGSLTAALALIYFGSVLIFQRLIPAQSEVAVVASTLAIAALFTSLRSRIQRAIDRRFYRQSYDAELILRSFGHRLRDEVDLDTLSHVLLSAAADSVQPAHLSLWLQEAAPEARGERR